MKNILQDAFKQEALSNKNQETDDLTQNLNPPFEIVGDQRTQERITDMINQIVESETGRSTLEIASKAGYKLGMEFVIGSNGGCSKKNKQIVLSPLSQDDILIGVLVHEARHAGQFERGEYDACDEMRPRNETLKTNIMRTRAVEADAQATAIQVLGEMMMNADNPEPLLAFARANQAIGKAFDAALYEEDALENGTARTAAFLAWYENEPIKKLYDEAYQIEIMERRVQNGKSKQDTYKNEQTAEKIVKDLCVDNKGGCYFKRKPKILEAEHYISVDKDVMKKLNDLTALASSPEKTAMGNILPFKNSPAKGNSNIIDIQKAMFSR